MILKITFCYAILCFLFYFFILYEINKMDQRKKKRLVIYSYEYIFQKSYQDTGIIISFKKSPTSIFFSV